jgi:hypothetical protein
VRGYTERIDRRVAKSRADIAWVHANVHAGEKRADVYAQLTSRGLVASNPAYNPGKPFDGGCSYVETSSAADWPRAGQPLPRTPCAYDFDPKARDQVRNPPVYVQFVLGFNLACGRALRQEYTFDEGDALVAVRDDDESQPCL